jgi:predicted subunit of tRNA(5-methylaminomethyl-2-thiouridylate) methyltransferase
MRSTDRTPFLSRVLFHLRVRTTISYVAPLSGFTGISALAIVCIFSRLIVRCILR